MATVVFAYNHARDPMHPGDLGSRIATSLSLSSMPVVDINPTQIIVTHPNVSEANRTAIQSLINAYTLDPDWKSRPPDNLGLIYVKAGQALPGNATFLANASPTNAQTVAQVKSLTRQVNALIRLQLRHLSDISDT